MHGAAADWKPVVGRAPGDRLCALFIMTCEKWQFNQVSDDPVRPDIIIGEPKAEDGRKH